MSDVHQPRAWFDNDRRRSPAMDERCSPSSVHHSTMTGEHCTQAMIFSHRSSRFPLADERRSQATSTANHCSPATIVPSPVFDRWRCDAVVKGSVEEIERRRGAEVVLGSSTTATAVSSSSAGLGEARDDAAAQQALGVARRSVAILAQARRHQPADKLRAQADTHAAPATPAVSAKPRPPTAGWPRAPVQPVLWRRSLFSIIIIIVAAAMNVSSLALPVSLLDNNDPHTALYSSLCEPTSTHPLRLH